ncbi:aspartate aminotransferase, cytoplasmic isoform X1 [Drosophila virilis]|uniref:Aspartate aminotransferase n=3 Tax=Drosophila virilis TaxID=7244 RepID=B4LCJ4_DROVI|nr:aspartate aminotransferase, cytoplasmic isoform X1 [Drosophila virilis]EDW69857.2 uncharacterized protein Dvir_GJ13489 [Drosophila virilis]
MLKFSSYSLLSKLNLFKCTSRDYCGSDDREKSAFKNIKTLPPMGVSHLTNLFQEDKNDNKVNLGVGVYRTEENQPYMLPVVKKCALELVENPDLNFEYLPVLGNPEFTKAATELILGKDCKAIKEKRIVGVQTISGSGALRIAVEFISQHLKKRTCYMSNPTWKNHSLILKQAGFKTLKGYPYWNASKRNIDIPKLLAALNEAKQGDVILLQPSAHNPTGMDPTKRQWKQIAQVIKERNLFPFFDVAYQGFATGDPDRDTWAVRYFVKEGIETLIAQSFSKNMGLYNERVGNLIVVLKDAKHFEAVASQFTIIIRTNYSNPPAFCSRVVAKLLTDEHNKKEWLKTIGEMVDRIKKMRKTLTKKLKELETPGTWDHIEKQRGMFSFLGLPPNQCDKLLKEKHIYLLNSGRINVCGLNLNNIDYVAKSIDEVVRQEISLRNQNDQVKCHEYLTEDREIEEQKSIN